MMKINLIAAITKNNCIGKEGKLAFMIKDDLKRFKEITEGNIVVMGSKTFETLPNGALPNRINIVITHNKEYTVHPKENDRVLIVTSIEDAIKLYKAWFYYEDGVLPCKQLFIIGGGSIYKQCLEINLIDRMYITKIDEEVMDGDTFFPQFNETDWILQSNLENTTESGVKYYFQVFDKKIV